MFTLLKATIKTKRYHKGGKNTVWKSVTSTVTKVNAKETIIADNYYGPLLVQLIVCLFLFFKQVLI